MTGSPGRSDARRVLACVDLSDASDAVVDCARALCQPGGTLVILHVAAPDPDFVGYEVGPRSVRDGVAKELRAEHLAVERLADRVRDSGSGSAITVTPLTVRGVAVERIVEHAERLGADYVVVGSSGHGAIHDLLVGSAVPGLLKRASVPVVVVPHRALAQGPAAKLA